MSKEKIINVRNIKDVTVKTHTNGFVLDFWAENTKGDNYTVKLYFEAWWVRHIARLLWKVVKNEQSEVDRSSSALEGGE